MNHEHTKLRRHEIGKAEAPCLLFRVFVLSSFRDDISPRLGSLVSQCPATIEALHGKMGSMGKTGRKSRSRRSRARRDLRERGALEFAGGTVNRPEKAHKTAFEAVVKRKTEHLFSNIGKLAGSLGGLRKAGIKTRSRRWRAHSLNLRGLDERGPQKWEKTAAAEKNLSSKNRGLLKHQGLGVRGQESGVLQKFRSQNAKCKMQNDRH